MSSCAELSEKLNQLKNGLPIELSDVEVATIIISCVCAIHPTSKLISGCTKEVSTSSPAFEVKLVTDPYGTVFILARKFAFLENFYTEKLGTMIKLLGDINDT